MKHICNICESSIEIHELSKPGDRISCPNCFAQLGIYKIDNKITLGCAACKKPVFDPIDCNDCERRRDKKALLKDGIL